MKTDTFTVDNAGDPDAIIVPADCDYLVIYEQGQAGTTDYNVYAPSKTDTPVLRPAGAKTEIRKGAKYRLGEIAGYAAAVTAGSYTFAIEAH